MHPLLRRVQRGATPSLAAWVDALGSTFDLLYELARTAQDPTRHAEGDVAAHTELVLQETYALLKGAASHLTPARRLTLVLAALLHDIGKPMVTKWRVGDDGQERLVAPYHADRGRSYLAYKLMELELPYPVVQDVLALVGHHDAPQFLVEREQPERAFRQLARLADLELLYFLELADQRGQRRPDQAEQIEYIELFRLFAEDYGLWGERDPYRAWHTFLDEALADWDATTRAFVVASAIRDYEAGLIFTPHEALARSFGYRDRYGQLVVLLGPSGAGKSLWAAEHLPDHAVVSLDALREQVTGSREDQSKNGRVRQLARDAIKEHLRRKERVVLDATNLRRDFRRAVTHIGFNYGAFVTFIVFHLPEAALYTRNRAQEHPVPDEVLSAQLTGLEWPDAAEAHSLVFIGEAGERL